MIQIQGVPVQGGLSIGPIRFLHRSDIAKERYSRLTPGEELLRFDAAKDRTFTELRRLQARMSAHLGSNEAAIFLFQSVMLEDQDYLDAIRSYINHSATAEYAVEQAEKEIIEFFASLSSSYLRSRSTDARDMSRRLRRNLAAPPDPAALSYMPAILAAEELAPSEAMLLDEGKLLGMVSHTGSADSHTTFLAQAMGVPALIGVEVDPRWEGRLAILDGDSGVLTLDPDEETVNAAQPHLAPDYTPPAARLRLPEELSVRLSASIDSAWEAVHAYALGAAGIAPFRTTLLFGGRETPPSEEEQLVEYRRTLSAMHGRPVVFESLDVGGIGMDGLLSMLGKPDRYAVLKSQLRAVLRASAAQPASIALAGVKSRSDIRYVRQLLRLCQTELNSERLDWREPSVGVEITQPVAILSVESFAEEADFLLLDGESLMQSTVPAWDSSVPPSYHALGWMLRRATVAARRSDCRMIVSGDWEHFPQAVGPLVKLGIDELSVQPSSLLPLLYLLTASEQ